MANESYAGNDQSYVAAGDLSTKQFLFMKNSGTAQTVTTAGLGDRTVGILQDKDGDAAGKAVRVRETGKSRLKVDGNAAAIAAGDFLGPDAAGKGIKVTADHKWVGARAEEASTVDGDIIEVTLLAFDISA